MTTFHQHVARLRLPLVAAPMTQVSTPALVTEAQRAGIVGSFPTSNAQSVAQLDEWFCEFAEAVNQSTGGIEPGPLAANLIVGKQNTRLDEDVACVVKHRPAFVITSVGSPAVVTPTLQAAGCMVLADVASQAHAHKALAAGVDGLVLLGAGAGGHTGWANPLAFVRAVRRFFDGPLVAAGGIADGAALWGAITSGYDLGFAGTRFIAAQEAGAQASWKDALVRSTMDDVSRTVAPNGVTASTLPDGAGSAGHTVSAVDQIQTTAAIVDEFETDWHQARARTTDLLR